ncbi:MAG: hypothetical protein JWO98_3890 [Frankiales bacterium]|nr:hypothetical protein [Frankiales bacterium]
MTPAPSPTEPTTASDLGAPGMTSPDVSGHGPARAGRRLDPGHEAVLRDVATTPIGKAGSR